MLMGIHDAYLNTFLLCMMFQFFEKQHGTISRTHLKRVWNAILYILSHGCRWEALPKDERYAHRALAHR